MDDAEVLHHDVPVNMLVRLAVGGFGGFLAVGGALDALGFAPPLHPNPLLTLAFLALRIFIGVGLVSWALFSPAQGWTVQRGLVAIDNRNPFRRWRVEIGAAEVKDFQVRRDEGVEGPLPGLWFWCGTTARRSSPGTSSAKKTPSDCSAR